jgi:hypothetical protein
MGTIKSKGTEKPKKGVAAKVKEKPKTVVTPVKKPDEKLKKAKGKEGKGKKKEVISPKATTKAKTVIKGSDKPVKKSAHTTSQKLKIPKPNDVKEANKKLYDAISIKQTTGQVGSTGKKYGSAKSVYSPSKEVVTTTHKDPQPIATPKRKKL